MVDTTANAPSPALLSPAALGLRLRTRIASLPWRLFAYAFGFNLLTSLPFLLDTSSGTRSAWWSLPIDDAWIHLNYVHGLATEGCFCYNTGIWEAGTTSWGWVLLLTPFYLVGHLWFGIDPAIVAKLVGIGLGAVTTLLIYYLVFRYTASKVVGLVIAGLVSVEPTWVFLRLSGMEGALVTPVVLGSAVALIHRRWALAGLLLAFAFWSRPEVGFYVAVAAVGGFLVWYVRWPQRAAFVSAFRALYSANGGSDESERIGLTSIRMYAGSTPAILLLGFPFLALLIWVVYNLSINGHIFPNTYLAKNDSTLPLFPWENIRILWDRGIGDFQQWVNGWRIFAGLPLAVIAAIAIVRRSGLLAIGLVLFVPLLFYGVASGIRFGDAGFNFFARRYIDPAVPILLMLSLLGGWFFINWLRTAVLRRVTHFSNRITLLIPIYVALGFFLVTSTVGQFDTHQQLTEDYSWNTRNIFDEDELAGLWLKRHAPPDSTVLIADAGAIRYFSELLTLDGVGLNTHENIGLPTMQIVIDSEPDFVAIWEDGVWDSLPNATKVARFDTPRNTILGGGPVGIYALDWSRQFAEVSLPVTVDEGLEVLDSLNLTDRKDETSHSHTISFVSFSPEALGSIDGVDIKGNGVSHDGDVQESFQMETIPGNDTDLVLRYRSDALPGLPAPAAIVRTNGIEVGQLPLNAGLGVMAETSIRVPGGLITSTTTRFDIEWEGFVTEFRWWTVDAGEGTVPPDGEIGGGGPGAPLVGAGPPDGAIAFDGFSAPDGAPPDLRVPDTLRHGGWWLQPGAGGVFTFRDAALVEESLDDTRDHHLIIDAGIADVSVRADIEWTGATAGLVIRHDGVSNDNMIFAWYDGESKRIHLAKIVAGRFTLAAETNRDWGPPNTIRHFELSAEGSKIQAKVDGVVVISVTIEELVENTYAGVFARGETVTAWDNFSLVPTGPLPE